MCLSSEPGRRAPAAAAAVWMAVWMAAGLACAAQAGVGDVRRPGPEAPVMEERPSAAVHEGLLLREAPEREARAARANSVLRCFQAGHLVYEGYDLRVDRKAWQAVELSALPGGSVQLLDLQDGLCVLENRTP